MALKSMENQTVTTMTASIQLLPGLQLAEFDSSAQSKMYRVELPSGEQFQINEMLYHFLEYLHQPTSLIEAATRFEKQTGQVVSGEELAKLEEQLQTFGVIVPAGEPSPLAEPAHPKPQSYFGIHYRKDILSAALLAPLANGLRFLFRRAIAIGLLALVIGVHIWAYWTPKDVNTISWPLLFVLMSISMFIHELGHLAACRYFGCSHGPLGVGLYFFSPVFYVDVTSAWRLNRWQRAVVDGGGIYFQLLTTPLLAMLFWMTQDQTFLYAIIFTNLILFDNLQPMMKLDGYWLIADLSGVPNLHVRSNELLQYGWEWLNWRIGRLAQPPHLSAFSQWSPLIYTVVVAYVVLSVVMWPVMLVLFIPMLIEIVRSYPALWQAALFSLLEALHSGDWGSFIPQLAALFLPTLILLNLGFLVKIGLEQRRQPKSQSI